MYATFLFLQHSPPVGFPFPALRQLLAQHPRFYAASDDSTDKLLKTCVTRYVSTQQLVL